MICPTYLTSNIEPRENKATPVCLEIYTVPQPALKANAVSTAIIQQHTWHKYSSTSYNVPGTESGLTHRLDEKTNAIAASHTFRSSLNPQFPLRSISPCFHFLI